MSTSNSADESPLPPGWEAKLDASSGKYYYVDHINCKSSWERPKALANSYDAPPPRPPPPPPAPTDLPPGWGSAVDPASGDSYYIDYMNRESTWTRPTKMAALGGSKSLPFDDLSTITGSVPQQVKKTTKSQSKGKAMKSTKKGGSTGSQKTAKIAGRKKTTSSSSIATVSTLGTQGTYGSTVVSSNNAKNTYVYINGIPVSKKKMKFPYPEAPKDPISDNLDIWVTQEAPKQRELAPKGLHAIRKAVAKKSTDRKTAMENVDVTNVSINGHRITLPQIRWWSVQWGVRFRSDTNYWYDKKAGFLGKLGGPLKWVVGAMINVNGRLHPRSSLGDTKIYINDREILKYEWKNWASLDMQLVQHTHYVIGPKGIVQRVGDNQPLYNWRHKEKAARKRATSKVPGNYARLGTKIVGLATKMLFENLRAAGNDVDMDDFGFDGDDFGGVTDDVEEGQEETEEVTEEEESEEGSDENDEVPVGDWEQYDDTGSAEIEDQAVESGEEDNESEVQDGKIVEKDEIGEEEYEVKGEEHN